MTSQSAETTFYVHLQHKNESSVVRLNPCPPNNGFLLHVHPYTKRAGGVRRAARAHGVRGAWVQAHYR